MTLGVDRLSLPAAEGAEDTWQTGFGFTKMSHADVRLVVCIVIALTDILCRRQRRKSGLFS